MELLPNLFANRLQSKLFTNLMICLLYLTYSKHLFMQMTLMLQEVAQAWVALVKATEAKVKLEKARDLLTKSQSW